MYKGKVEGYRIKGKEQKWVDFANVSEASLDLIKNYVYMKVKLVFDPPSSSVNIETYNKLISEYEWRLYTASEFKMS